MPFRVSRRAVTLPPVSSTVRSVDVYFGEQRVWSIDLAGAARAWHRRLTKHLPVVLGRNRYPWPEALDDYLFGHTEVILRDSSDGSELGRAAIRFSNTNVPTRVVDRENEPLSVNKWGRLSKTLAIGAGKLQERILANTEELVRLLENLGLRPFIVGGTLLGAVREGSLLVHDDDADIAYLSRHTDPADVAREGFAVGHNLTSLGYEVVRHSATHMQILFRDVKGEVDHYIDVFGAFFSEGGYINQPFHVRGTMREDQILPFNTISISRHSFPVPADVDRWLTINYDKEWQTPIPGYRLSTPRDTIRRFDNWFGIFSIGREFWNDYYRESLLKPRPTTSLLWATGARWILAHSLDLKSEWCIDLGGGDGSMAALLQERTNQQIITADYSQYAIEAAERHSHERLHIHHINLLQVDSLALPREAGIRGAFDLVSNHLLDSLDTHARPQALSLIRMALKSGGAALATLYAKRDPERPDADPDNWFWKSEDLSREAAKFGMITAITRLRPAAHERRRSPYAVRFHLRTQPEEVLTL